MAKPYKTLSLNRYVVKDGKFKRDWRTTAEGSLLVTEGELKRLKGKQATPRKGGIFWSDERDNVYADWEKSWGRIRKTPSRFHIIITNAQYKRLKEKYRERFRKNYHRYPGGPVGQFKPEIRRKNYQEELRKWKEARRRGHFR